MSTRDFFASISGNIGSLAQILQNFHNNQISEKLIVNLIDGVCDILPLHNQIQKRLLAEKDNEKLQKYLQIAEGLIQQQIDNPKDRDVLNKFLDLARQFCNDDLEVYHQRSKKEKQLCENCQGEIDVNVNTCPNCGSILQFDDGVKNSIIIQKKKKKNNGECFRSYLYERYLGFYPLVEKDAINKVVEKLRKHFEAEDIDKTPQEVIKYLTKIGQKSHCKNIPIICYYLWKMPLPNITPTQMDELFKQYNMVDSIYRELKDNNFTTRSSALNSSFVLGKLLARIGHVYNPYYLKPIETQITLDQHNEIWNRICEKLN